MSGKIEGMTAFMFSSASVGNWNSLPNATDHCTSHCIGPAPSPLDSEPVTRHPHPAKKKREDHPERASPPAARTLFVMTEPARFFLTTAIDYPNSRPHIGTAFEKLG